VPEIPEAAIAAAADAIMSAANLNDGESEQWESRHLARTALEAAAPLLAQAVRREIEARLREHYETAKRRRLYGVALQS